MVCRCVCPTQRLFHVDWWYRWWRYHFYCKYLESMCPICGLLRLSIFLLHPIFPLDLVPPIWDAVEFGWLQCRASKFLQNVALFWKSIRKNEFKQNFVIYRFFFSLKSWILTTTRTILVSSSITKINLPLSCILLLKKKYKISNMNNFC